MKKKLKELVWKNFMAAVKSWAVDSDKASAEVFEDADFFRYISYIQMPLFNGIIQKCTSFESKMEEQFQSLEKKHLPFCWWLDPEVHPEATGKILEEKKCVNPGTYTGVAAPVKSFPILEIPDVEIIEVKTTKEYQDWGVVLGANFGMHGQVLKDYLHVASNFGEGKPNRHYLAKYQGKAVGSMSLFCSPGVCGLWNGGVIPEARNKGIATALGIACMNETKNLGFTTAVAILMAGKMAQNLLNKLGFQEVCYMIPYIHGYNPDDLEPTKKA